MTGVYDLGPFRLDAGVGVLTRAGRPTPLGFRAVSVLATLVEHAGEWVPKTAIIDTAWPGRIVEEGNLAVQISAIRRVLAIAPGGDRWVETLSRRGYRYVGPASLTDPAHAPAGPAHSNLPEAPTSFVGRERELAEIKRLLPGNRLITLVGSGGVGKTRLALQAAAEVLDAYRDGVWWVELGRLADAARVPTAVAQAIGVPDHAGASLVQTLCTQLSGRRLLLILDNCEHLLESAGALVDVMLRSTTGPTIMATSREPLRIAGEHVVALPTLSLPGVNADPRQVAASEAVQLFVERARQMQPGFTLTDARARVVGQLCLRLDGIPLALELAAARIRTLSIEQIAARLDDRFRLLAAGSPVALPRQQTLRATLDWSYDLLTEGERAVLRRLAVFPGSFAIAAASAVALDGTIDEVAVVDIVAQLVARSLVAADVSGVTARYRLLETTRAYAMEKLDEAGESDAVRRLHAVHYRGLLDPATDDWLRMPDADWRAIYRDELDNVRSAIDWAFSAGGNAPIGVGLTAASGPVWSDWSLQAEARARLQRAIDASDARIPASDQARLQFWLGSMWDRASPAQTVSCMDRAIEFYRRAREPVLLGHALARRGNNLAVMGRHAEAERSFAEALATLEREGVPRPLGHCHECVGVLAMGRGDLGAARARYEKALALYRDAGAGQHALEVLGSLADTTWALGDLDAAQRDFRRIIEVLRKAPGTTRGKIGINLCNLAGVLVERGDLAEAFVAGREGLPLLGEGGYAWIVVDHFALRAALAGRIEDAARLGGFGDAAHAARESARQPNEARARAGLQPLLAAQLQADVIVRLAAEGAVIREDEAIALALRA